MGIDSKIEWTENTFNPWIGCTRISPACDHCYAADLSARTFKVKWGAGEARKRTSESYWKQPLKWDAEAAKSGARPRVFCASLADVFDNEVSDEWRADLLDLIRKTPGLDWMILTKRIGNWYSMVTKARDSCEAFDVPFMLKQHGEWLPALKVGNDFEFCDQNTTPHIGWLDKPTHEFGDGYVAFKVGKKAAGRLLDGVEHNGRVAT